MVTEAVSVGDMPQITNLVLSFSDRGDGALDAGWDYVEGARSYEVEMSFDDTKPDGWVKLMTAPQSNATLTGLQSGKRVWIRVRAIGPTGPGALERCRQQDGAVRKDLCNRLKRAVRTSLAAGSWRTDGVKPAAPFAIAG